MTTLKIRGKYITDAGIILRVTRETPKYYKGIIVDTWFPVHHKPWGAEQVDANRREYLHEVLVGQERTFTKASPLIEEIS